MNSVSNAYFSFLQFTFNWIMDSQGTEITAHCMWYMPFSALHSLIHRVGFQHIFVT